MKKISVIFIVVVLSLAGMFGQEVLSISVQELDEICNRDYRVFEQFFGYQENNSEPIIIEITDKIIDGKALSKCLQSINSRSFILDLSQVKTVNNPLNFGYVNRIKEFICADDANINFSFYSNNSIEKVKIPATLKTIAHSTFYGATNLKEVIIPQNSELKKIDTTAFYGCKNLERLDLPVSCNSIGLKAFEDCKKLKYIDLKNIIRYDENAFAGCESLEKVIINDQVTSLINTFIGCKGLQEVTLGKNIEEYYSAFAGCYNLKKVNIPKKSNRFVIFNNALMNKEKTALYFVLAGTKVDTYRIPDTVTFIDYFAFANDVQIRKISNITTANSYAFSECKTLEEVEFSNNVTEFNRGCFEKCPNLKTVTFPAEIEVLKDYIFLGCSNLETVIFKDINPSVYKGNFIDDKIMPYFMFQNCTNLKNVTLPSNLEKISSGMFYNSGIESITIPETVKVIGSSAFKNAKKLRELIIPGNVEVLENNIISGCDLITEITIPASVKEIKSSVFAECPSLKRINYQGTTEQFMQINQGKFSVLFSDCEINIVHCSNGILDLNAFRTDEEEY